ncbi:adenylate/guanylate cyclase catalytic domain protein [Leptospira broomii serovar Hurstbridge str. 5399]|uniref:Adenylate/guanylate cyclase catalytic domain protein n=1 Tax=Leptospira broomii serovar Hurstbridge str. 5399 TaxID=1049789 RepID=T0FBU0_9LEPT|nr:adenylate/guanylate cyclase domain-containing protein [Leptospira broomii]EQA45346.1 adenylate/guanylate cyclase catalytic domain protein [Leptospira broomii serovar Hurstbridge str. 5399]
MGQSVFRRLTFVLLLTLLIAQSGCARRKDNSSFIDFGTLKWEGVWLTDPKLAADESAPAKSKKKISAPDYRWIELPSFPFAFTKIFPIAPGSGLHEVEVRAVFEFDKDEKLLKIPSGIYLPDIGENWIVELNEVLLREERYYGADRDLVKRRSLKGLIIPINSGILKPNKNEIKIRFFGTAPVTKYVPNDHFGFYHASGFKISPLEEIYDSNSEYLDIFLFGIYFIFGFYHVLFYITRRQDSYYLYFGFFSLLSSVYFYSTSYHIYHKFVNFQNGPDTSYFYRLEFSSLIPIVPLFMLFIKDFFYQKERTFWAIRVFCTVSSVFFIATWVLPFEFLLPNLRLFQFFLIPMLLYVLFFSFQAIRKNKPDSIKLAVGIGICVIFGIWDTLDAIYKIIGIHYPYFKVAYFAFILIIISLLVSRYVSLYRESQQLNLEISQQRDAFYRFVPSEFISILDRRNPVDIKIGDSREKTMSVFFADLKGYTSISERLTPDENIKYLNKYFSGFEDIIYKNAGFIDKYIGDAILALFSDHSERAEKERFNSADNALQSAIDMVRFVGTIDDGKTGLADLGIGINTGPLILGTVGSERRIDTTVVGDTVNLSSRVQNLTTFYKTKILITHHTYLRLNLLSDIRAREIDTVIVKGKTQPVILYEVYEADPPELAEWKDTVRSKLTEGIILYKVGNFKEAFSIFRELYKEKPLDSVVRLYAKRTKLFLNQPPSADWDGVFRLHRK